MFKVTNSSHWYQQDGTPAFDADLRKARKGGLLPSVTNVLGILAKPGIDVWKQNQAVMAALTLPKIENESESDFVKRIVDDAQKQSEDAREFGTAIHAQIQAHFTMPDGIAKFEDQKKQAICDKAITELSKLLSSTNIKSEICCIHNAMGFAGTIDFIGKFSDVKDDKAYVIDFKTQNVKDRPVFYPEYLWQIAAYRYANGDFSLGCANIIIDSNTGNCYTKIYDTAEIERATLIFLAVLQAFKLIKKL